MHNENVPKLQPDELHVILLEERIAPGHYAGPAIFGCPHCSNPIRLRLSASRDGRSISLYMDPTLRVEHIEWHRR